MKKQYQKNFKCAIDDEPEREECDMLNHDIYCPHAAIPILEERNGMPICPFFNVKKHQWFNINGYESR